MALTPESLESYRKLSQAMNKRLQRLERLSKQPGYKAATNWAYQAALSDIRALRGEGARRFPSLPKKLPTDPAKLTELEVKLRRSTKAMERFRDLPSGTKTGLHTVYDNMAESFSEGAETEITADDLAGVFETGLWDTLISAGFGSETTRRVIGMIKDNKEKLRKLRKQKRAMRLSPDEAYGERVNELLEGNRSAARILGKYLNSIK